MLKYQLRITDRQRHINRKNLLTRINNHDGSSFVINEDHDTVVNKYGQVLSKEGKHIIVLKGNCYPLRFDNDTTTVYTKAFDPTAPVMS